MADDINEAIAWVAAADMGLGHKRAAWPLRHLSPGGVYVAGSASDTSDAEKALWSKLRHGYELISRMKRLPLIGEGLFWLYDRFQAIPKAYPFRDLSRPTASVRYAARVVRQGLGSSLLSRMEKKPLPLLTTFYATMLAAENAAWSRVYCVICDADVNRIWVPEDPKRSRVEYLVPCGKALRRLKQFGVPDERIYMTGFPLPLELTGDEKLDTLRSDLAKRLKRLDPKGRFWSLHQASVEHFLGVDKSREPSGTASAPFTISFAVGGAGAQAELAVEILRSLHPVLAEGVCHLNLIAGLRPEVKVFFETALREVKSRGPLPDNSVSVIFGDTDEAYFSAFTACLRETDVLWTKPSELSFYAGLGLPLIIAPTIGAHEERNREWLIEVQAGIDQKDPRYADEWLLDLWRDGRLAEAAWNGFLKARKYGTYKIRELVETGAMVRETDPLKR